MKTIIGILKRFALIFLLLGLAGSLYFNHVQFTAYGDLDNQIKELQLENLKLQTNNQNLAYDASRWNAYAARIDSIRYEGYKPDSLLVVCIMKELERFPSLNWSFINDVAKNESSWGDNKQDGTIGEKGWAQIRPETLAHFINMLGGDTTGINYDEYKNTRTATEWAFRIFFYAKINRGSNSWAEHNNGNFMIKRKKGK